jgi:hypothetical protein
LRCANESSALLCLLLLEFLFSLLLLLLHISN